MAKDLLPYLLLSVSAPQIYLLLLKAALFLYILWEKGG